MNLRWCRLLMASLCCTVNGTSLEGSQRAASLASPILLAYHWCITSLLSALQLEQQLILLYSVGVWDQLMRHSCTFQQCGIYEEWPLLLACPAFPVLNLSASLRQNVNSHTHLREFLTTDGSHSKSVIVFGNRLDLPGFLQDFSPNSYLDLKSFLWQPW